jgi:hypothetical protein
MVFVQSNRSGWRMISGAGSGMVETRKLAPAAAGRWFASLNKSNGEPPLHVLVIPSPAHQMGGRGPG